MAQTHSDFIHSVAERVRARTDEATAAMFERCFENTLGTTLREMPDGTLFMLTGDIPAMWLRDSTAQLGPYLHFAAEDQTISDMITAVSRRQIEYVLLDPYANAFNAEPDGSGHQSDLTEQSPWIWERKYEVDSLCYPVQLAYDLWTTTGRTDHLGDSFARAARTIIELWRTEQDHEARSTYRFERFDCPSTDTLVREGRGSETAPTGLTWSAFRPSDDACEYGYNVPGNMFAAVELQHIETIATEVLHDPDLAASARDLRADIQRGIEQHTIVASPSGDDIYAYEVDGRGGILLLDDANVPSLLSLPLIGWCGTDDPLYLATRAFILSTANPVYFTGILPSGTDASGLGSPHTPVDHVWPIGLCIEALTTDDRAEKERILRLLLETDAGTGLMHESFLVTDPTVFTREWFSWANAMFCELVLDMTGLRTVERRPEPRAPLTEARPA
ncbi:glycoside hydrolase family 125 protein [uncultured Microbacterium sp.]|uniref:glycoside hydrolase family 125 protein n=1 Tax=uncultured Microbacterium sp. TaxID=191216 RepID=UPI0025CB9DEF|nr:glycoside hydrolase family 125 protein [uncultured Microbacterium sp.]